MTYAREDMLAALRAYAEENGEPPTFDAWLGRRPGRTSLRDRFGSWNAALAAAGLRARPQGGREAPDGYREESAALEARMAAGEPLAALAAELGVTSQALGRRLARHRKTSGALRPA